MDEVLYYDGHWYMAKKPEFVLPPFEFHQPDYHMMRMWQWSESLVNRPGPLALVTGV